MPDHTKTMKRNHWNSCTFTLSTLLLASLSQLQAQDAAYQKIENGIQLKVGEAVVELTAATPTALHLGVSYSGTSAPAASVFLAGPVGREQVNWQPVQQGALVGIKTDAGELLVDPAQHQWTLEDANGQTLIPPCDLGHADTGSVVVSVGWDKDTPVTVYGCGNGTRALEQSDVKTRVGNGVAVVPYFWAPKGYGVLALAGDDNKPAFWSATPGQGYINWTFPGGTADLYLMPAANLRAVATAFDQLTGFPPVPPRWAFGYMQSRYGWKDRAYVEDAFHQFLTRNLPLDVLIFDFEWYTKHPDYSVRPEGEADFSDFGWNPLLFPNPTAQIADFNAHGVHFVGIRKPRLGNTALLNMMREKGWGLAGLQQGRGLDARGLNYRDPAVRAWYAPQLGPLLACGIDGWWNDEGEGTYCTYYYWNLAEQDAQERFRPGMRLWTLNRAFEPGLQRLGAAAWTGDIGTSWAQLALTPTHLLNWSLAGMPYGACDLGGFLGTPTPQMFTRWMQVGAFLPVMRAHSDVKVQPHFPWLYGLEAEKDIRLALDLRYRLIPYYYSLAYEAHDTGVPLMRPLVMEFPQDPNVANMSDQWFMGDGLMVAPIITESNQRSVYLPAGDWYDFTSHQRLEGNRTITVTAGLDEIPLYVRAGSILPLGPVIQHTSELPGGPLEVQVYPGRDATFTLMEDDGKTTAYLNGQFRRTTFTWDDAARRLSWKVEGPYAGKDIFKHMKVEVFDPQGVHQAKGSLFSSGSVTVK